MTAVNASLAGLPRARSLAIEGVEIGVAAAGCNSGHVERLSNVRPSAFDAALAAHFAGVAIHGRDAGKGCNLSATQQAKLRQAGHKRHGDDGSDATDRGKDIATPLQAGVFREKNLESRLKTCDQAGLGAELRFQQALQNRACSGGDLVLQSRLTGFGRLPRQNQFLELSQPLGRNRGRLRPDGGAIERKQACVDGIGLGELAKRIGELSSSGRD